jgi:hypothetical protein
MLASLLVRCAVAAAAAEAPAPAASPSPASAERVVHLPAEELRARPRPSDPWSILRDVPGIVLDRVDVGGSETAMQSLLISRGDPGSGATWTLDGIDITDPASPGAAAFYPDTALAAALDARTDTGDVHLRTPGVHVGLTLPLPLARWTGGARIAGSVAQSDNLPESLEGRPFARSRTQSAREMEADAGGPIARDRLWFWGGFSRRALEQDVFTEHEDRASVTSFVGKARLRVGGAHLTALALRSEKTQDARDPTLTAAPDARWRQSGPNHLYALDARSTYRGVALLARVSALRAGFRLDPAGGTASAMFEDFRGIAQRSYLTSVTERPRDEAVLEGSTERDAFGFEHRLALGGGYSRSHVRTHAEWPGNEVLALERRSVFFRAFELTGFALPTRAQDAETLQERGFAHLEDSARRGRLAVTIGARVERVTGRNLASSVSANREFPDLLPAIGYGGGPTTVDWLDLLPRASAAWDLSPRTSIGLGYAAFAGPLSAADIAFDNPIGRDVASLTYYWLDRDGDGTVDTGELDLVRGRVGASAVDPDDPESIVSPNVVDGDLRSPRTHALRAGLHHSAGRWTGDVHASWRRLVRPLWRPLRTLTTGDYVIRGAVTGELHGDAYTVGYYAPASASLIVPGNGRVLDNREGYSQDAISAEVVVAARWSRAHAEAWAAFTDWRELFPDRSRAVQDPTSLESDPLRDGGAVAARPGGLGRGDVVANARFTAGALLRASLPWRLEASAIAHAREGFPIPYFQVADTGDPTGGSKAVLVSPRLDAFRLPALFLLDARLARDVAIRRATVTAFVDVFNLLNTAATLQVARDVDLPALDRPREIVRPRLVRVGLAMRF